MPRSSILILASGLVFISIFGVTAGAFLLTKWLDPFDTRPFDPKAWAEADMDGKAAMARDAIRHIRAGMPENDIRGLLGEREPHETRRLTGSAPPGALRTYSYPLGFWGSSFYGYDSTYLWVHVGADGKVIAAVIGGG
jgi:hypothetical protein